MVIGPGWQSIQGRRRENDADRRRFVAVVKLGVAGHRPHAEIRTPPERAGGGGIGTERRTADQDCDRAGEDQGEAHGIPAYHQRSDSGPTAAPQMTTTGLDHFCCDVPPHGRSSFSQLFIGHVAIAPLCRNGRRLNARFQPPLEAGARQERTLSGVG